MTISKPLINLLQNYKTRGASAAQARLGVNYAIDAKTIYLGPLPCLWKKISRPYLRYPPSLHAPKDWWDKYDITWFLRGGGGGEQVIKSAKNRKRGRVCLFQTTGNEQLFILKTITENYGWKWSLLLFWMSSSRKCSHTSKTCRNSNHTFCMTTKSSFLFWDNKQTRPEFLVLYPVTSLLSHQFIFGLVFGKQNTLKTGKIA